MPDPVLIFVDNRVRLAIPKGGFDKEFLDGLCSLFEHPNPQYQKLRSMGYAAHNEPRVLRTWEHDPAGYLTFPRGGLTRMRQVLREHGRGWLLSDRRQEGAEELDVEYLPPGPVEPYQEEAVLALHARQNALLRLPTGGRKTSIGMILASRARTTTLVLVDTTALAEQWIERAGKELGIPPEQVGRIYGGDFSLRPFTVGMHASVVSRARKEKDRKRMTAYFGCVIGDEIQGAAAARSFEAIDLFPAKYRFGISASERRRDGKECLTYDLFGSVAYEVERERLVELGVILDVEIRVLASDFDAPWYGHPDAGDDEKDLDFNRLLDEMQRDDARNALVVDALAGEVRAGEQAVAIAHRRDHCRTLASMFVARSLATGYLIGGDDYAEEFAATRDGIRSGSIRVGVGTVGAVGKGIDLPAVGVGAVCTPMAANREKLNQARGRFCRKPDGKTRAVLYYVLDWRVVPSHLRNLVAWNPTVRVMEGDRWVDAKGSLLWARCEERRKYRASRSSDVLKGL